MDIAENTKLLVFVKDRQVKDRNGNDLTITDYTASITKKGLDDNFERMPVRVKFTGELLKSARECMNTKHYYICTIKEAFLSFDSWKDENDKINYQLEVIIKELSAVEEKELKEKKEVKNPFKK